MTEESEFAAALWRVSRQWRTRLDARLRGLGLTQARWVVLLALSQLGSAKQKELAAVVGVEGPTLVRILDSLEEQGLISRRAFPDDRRAKLVQLTRKAEPILEQIQDIAEGLRHELLNGVTTADLSAASQVLGTIGERLERG